MSKRLRPSQKTQKNTVQNIGFRLIFSNTILGPSLYIPSFSPFLGSQQSWLSAQIQKVILQSSLCVPTFQHTSLLQGTSAYIHRDSAYTREFSYCFLALLNAPEGTAPSAMMQQSCPTTIAAHSWRLRAETTLSLAVCIFQEWTDQQQQWHEIIRRETL